VTPPDTSLVRSNVCSDPRTGTEFRYSAARVTASGNIDTAAASPETPCLGASDAIGLKSVRSPGGDALVAWVDERSGESDIYIQRRTAAGDLAVGWPMDGRPVCSAAHCQYDLDVAPDGGGGAWLAWQDYRAGVEGRLYVQHVTAEGSSAPGWPGEGAPACASPGEQAAPRLVADGSGGVFVLWLDRRSGVLDLYGQRFSGSRPTPLWDETGKTLASGSGSRTGLCAAAAGGAGIVVAWQERTGAGTQVRALRVTADGTATSGWAPEGLALNEPNAVVGPPAVAVDSSGNAFVCWAERGEARSGVYAACVTPSGSVASGWPAGGLAVSTAPAGLGAPTLRWAGPTDVMVAWEDWRSGADSDLYLQRITGAGELASGWPAGGLAVSTAAGNQYQPTLAVDAIGAALVTWLDDGEGQQTGLALAAGRAGGLPQLLEVKALPTRVKLVWQLPSSGGVELRVHRRIPAGEWQSREVQPGKESRLVFEDREVQPGDTLEYRLEVRRGPAATFLQPLGVRVPLAPPALALSRARLSVALRSILATVALPTAEPANLELFDVAGRRLVSHPVGSLGVGEHEVQLSLPSRPGRSVYFLRLVQGRQSRVAKVVYLH
jgi:hypothetical protein